MVNMKGLLLIISAIWFLGCWTTTPKDSTVVGTISEYNEDSSSDVKEGQKPPKELKLSSILYELAISQEPEKFSQKNDIFLAEGRVRVFIVFNPASSKSERDVLTENYNLMVEKKSDNLLRALVPINRLIPLSKDSIIWSIQLPDKPQNQ